MTDKTATAQPTSEIHNRAVAQAAKGSVALLKDPTRAVEYYKAAIKMEPGHRDWNSFLALALYKAGRTEEAVPIWKSLATGSDNEASNATKMLAKVGRTPKG